MGASLTISAFGPDYKKGGFIGDAEDGCLASLIQGPGKCSEMLREKSEDKDEDAPKRIFRLGTRRKKGGPTSRLLTSVIS